MIKKTFGELCDELSILILKRERLGGYFGSKQKMRMFELFKYYSLAIKVLDKDGIKNAKLYFRELHDANSEIWNLEESLRNLKIKNWYTGQHLYAEMGKRAESIREINGYRVTYKNKLNELFDDINEIKVNHISGQK